MSHRRDRIPMLSLQHGFGKDRSESAESKDSFDVLAPIPPTATTTARVPYGSWRFFGREWCSVSMLGSPVWPNNSGCR